MSPDRDAPPSPALEPAFEPAFEMVHESEVPPEVLNRRICDFDLQIEGRPLGRVIDRFRAEIAGLGIGVKPVFYLTDGWGVVEGTVAIGIPFYLADPTLLRAHQQHGALIEGDSDEDILRYLRHEMGHVVNYAYRLHATEEWTALFGPMSRPYVEEYRVEPFSAAFVRHLPGGYAQKHPDEDWAETFAVWMSPDATWRELYVDSTGALAKLDYCARTMEQLKDRPPEVVDVKLDLEAKDIHATVQEYYAGFAIGDVKVPRSLDGDLQVIFARPKPAAAPAADAAGSRTGDAALLLRRQRDSLSHSVYRWTGVDSAVTESLIGHLVERAKVLKITYPLGARDEILVELSGFLTTLAMNYVYKGRFIGN